MYRASQIIKLFEDENPPTFLWYVDLDERGMFHAHVDDEDGNTIFTYSNENNVGDEEGEVHKEYGDLWLVTDGFMKHAKDLAGLEKYLKQMKIIPADGLLVNGYDYERKERENKDKWYGISRGKKGESEEGYPKFVYFNGEFYYTSKDAHRKHGKPISVVYDKEQEEKAVAELERLRAEKMKGKEKKNEADDLSGLDLEDMVLHYLIAALQFSSDESTPEGGKPLDANYDTNDIADSSWDKARKDCKSFIKKADPKYLQNASAEQIGYDFWLTRNRYGTGFWDKPEIYGGKEGGKALTKLSHSFGELDPHVGDDGKVYIE